MNGASILLTVLLAAAHLGAQGPCPDGTIQGPPAAVQPAAGPGLPVGPDGIVPGSAAGGMSSPLAVTADFTTFGSGCVGTGSGRCGPGLVCTSGNGSETTNGTPTFVTGADFVIRHTAGAARSIGGFQILVKATTAGVTPAFLFVGDSQGPIGSPVRMGILAYSPDSEWATVTFARPFVVTAGAYYFPGFTNPSPSLMPVSTSAANLYHYWRTSPAAAWAGPFNTHPWAVRILCSENPCQSLNAETMSSTGSMATNATFLIRIKAETNTRISGFELPLKSAVDGETETYLYLADAAGKPTGSPVRTGVMRFTPFTTWQATRFYATYHVPAGSYFFIGFKNPAASVAPLASSGAYGTHFWMSSTSTSWSGPFNTTRWAYRLNKEQNYPDSLNTLENANTAGTNMAKNAVFAVVETAAVARDIIGFELLLKGAAEGAMEAYLYDADTAGKPIGSPVRTTTIPFGIGTTWARAVFPTYHSVAAGNKYCVAFRTHATHTVWPIASTGSMGTHYWMSSTSTSWSGPFSTQPWAYRVLCDTSAMASTPAMGNRGLPVLGTTFSVDLNFARPSSAAIHFIGISNSAMGPLPLPLYLGGLGASGCSLLVSPDFGFAVPISSSGFGSISFNIPNVNALEGGRIYHQWIVVDPPGNTLGLIFSDGGASILGR